MATVTLYIVESRDGEELAIYSPRQYRDKDRASRDAKEFAQVENGLLLKVTYNIVNVECLADYSDTDMEY